MEVNQEENQEVEVRAEPEAGSMEALQQKVAEINNHDTDEDVEAPQEQPVAEAASEDEAEVRAKPATTEEAGVIAENDYKPSYKFVHKGQELEIDEVFKPLIKDEASEKKFQEISQKLAFVEDTKEIRQKWEQSQETLNMVDECQRLYEEGTQKNDVTKLERLVETIGLTDEQLFNVARAKLERRNLEPAQRAQYEKQRQLELDNERMMRENQQYQSQLQAESRRTIEFQLDNQLARPDIQDLRRTYEENHGAGSFRDLLINEGHAASITSGQMVPPNVVMEGILKQYGPFIRSQAASQQPQAQQVNQQPKRVVTNVAATGSSPSRARASSLDDLRKLREDRYGDE